MIQATLVEAFPLVKNKPRRRLRDLGELDVGWVQPSDVYYHAEEDIYYLDPNVFIENDIDGQNIVAVQNWMNQMHIFVPSGYYHPPTNDREGVTLREYFNLRVNHVIGQRLPEDEENGEGPEDDPEEN